MSQDQQQSDPIIDAAEAELPPREQVSRLMDDVRELVQVEMAYLRSRIDYSRHVVRWSARFGMIAAFAFSCASIALVLGLVMTLAPRVGPGVATLIVTGSFGLVGVIAGYFARKWIRRIYFPELEQDGNGDA